MNAFLAASAVALGLSVFMAPSEGSAAATIAFDLRVSAVNGVPYGDSKTADQPGLGGTVTLQLFAIITNTDFDQTNDGLLAVSGSFISVSSSGSTGIWSALGTNQSEVEPDFRGIGSQSGLLATTDNNGGGFDLGSPGGASDTRIPDPNPYFSANSVTNFTKFGTNASTPSNLEFLVGTKTFTITSSGVVTMSLSFVGRNTVALSKPVKWTSDGVVYTKSGNNTAFIGYGLPVFFRFPEPSAFSLMLAGAFGWIGSRRVDRSPLR